MLREQFINFLETAVVLLVLTNAFSAVVAGYALSIAHGRIPSNAGLPEPIGLLGLFTRRLRAGTRGERRPA